MKTSSKPLTAFEVYNLKKTPGARLTPPSKSKIKKKKRKMVIQDKKLKRAAALSLNTSKKKSGGKKVLTRSAGKLNKVDNKTLVSNVVVNNNVNDNKKKQRKKNNKVSLPLTTENSCSPVIDVGKCAVNREAKPKSGRTNFNSKKLINEREISKNSRSAINRDKRAELKMKIAQVKRLVNKKVDKKSQAAAADEESFDDLSFDSDKNEEEFGDEDVEGEGLENGEDSPEGEQMSYNIETFSGKELNALNSQDSRKVGQETFQWIIKPYSEKDFFSKFWEKTPLLVKRKEQTYYKGLFSTQDFDKILHEQVILYSKNLDVTSYSDGKRQTHNPIGQAHAPVVWDYYNNGCSLRMLNPQTFHPRVWKCLSSLQEYFNSFCGANVYLTPPDTQGFAPHWDDIEAFILQLEGKKRWRVYAPRCDDEVLPDYSSQNLTQEGIGEPILDTILEAGDLLYFPRGYIHQGHAVENEHSLHITLSTYQKNGWGHYLEKLLPQALSLAMSEDVEFRRGLPRGYLDYMGIVHMETEAEERVAFKKKVCDLVMRMLENAPFDSTADQRGLSFIRDCLPPYLTQEDKVCSAYGGGERWCAKKKKVINRVELQPDTPIRLIRGNCIRLVAEEDNVHIYHCLENSREYHKEEPQFLEVAAVNAPAIETLIHTYPSYVTIESLPLQDEGEKMTVASGLWERGLLLSAHPLDPQYDD